MSFTFKVETQQESGSLAFIATHTVDQAAPVELVITADHPLYADFAQFGYKTHVRNAFAMNKEAREAMSGAEAVALLEKRLTRYEAGEWNMEREEGAQPSGGDLATALVTLSGKTLEEVRKYLSGLGADDKERGKIHRKIAEREDVAAEIAKIRRARNADKPKADLSALGI